MPYKIKIDSTGHEFAAEANETVLTAALRHGLTLPYGCRSGFCGACAGELLSGTVTYAEETPGLDEADKAAGKALFCQALPRSDLRIAVQEVHTPADVQVKTLPCKVVRKELLAHDVMRVWLKLPEAQRLQFLAGQYLDVLTPEGRRSFSIANAPHDDGLLELHIRRVEGGEFTDYVFTELKEKAIWRIEAPLGTFFLREDDRPSIFIGGGTGFAPLKGMLEHAFYVGDQRPMHLFWGVRARRDLYLDELARDWAARHPNFRYTPVLSAAQPEDDWNGETGFVHEAVLRAYADLGAYDVYMSGPPVMIEAARAAVLRHGLAEERMFSDAFEYNRQAAVRAAVAGKG